MAVSATMSGRRLSQLAQLSEVQTVCTNLEKENRDLKALVESLKSSSSAGDALKEINRLTEENAALKQELDSLKELKHKQDSLLFSVARESTPMSDDDYRRKKERLMASKREGKVTQKRNAQAQEEIRVLKDEVVAWLNRVLGIDLTGENLYERLSNGIILCDLLTKVANVTWPRLHKTAAPRSFFAHDNVTAFLLKVSSIGVQAFHICDVNDIVLYHAYTARNVIHFILAIARAAVNYGIIPPDVVRIEMELEQQKLNAKKAVADEGKDDIHPKLIEYCQANNITKPPERLRKGVYKFSDQVTAFVQVVRDTLLVRYQDKWDDFVSFCAKYLVDSEVSLAQGRVEDISGKLIRAAMGENRGMARLSDSGMSDADALSVGSATRGMSVSMSSVGSNGSSASTMVKSPPTGSSTIMSTPVKTTKSVVAMTPTTHSQLHNEVGIEVQTPKPHMSSMAQHVMTLDAATIAESSEDGMQAVLTDNNVSGSSAMRLSRVDSSSQLSVLSVSETEEVREARLARERRQAAEYTAKKEFFYLTMLAVKMHHDLKHEDEVTGVRTADLWDKALEQDIMFYDFYTWIKNELTKIYLKAYLEARERLAASTDADGQNGLRRLRASTMASMQQRKQMQSDRAVSDPPGAPTTVESFPEEFSV